MRLFVFALVLCSIAPAAAGEVVCPQTHVAAVHQAAAPQVLAYPQPIVAAPLAYPQQLVAPAGLAGTIYGYQAQPLAQGLAENPYRLDPAAMLRDAARFADSSQSLAQRSLDVYQRLGTDALAIQAETEQLRARAALIDATRPHSPVGQLAGGHARESQQLAIGGATICVEPDGRGGFLIRVVPAGPAPVDAAAVAPADPPESPAAPSTGERIPEGVRTLAMRCAACHTGDDAKGGVRLFADAETLLPIDADLAERILAEALRGTMPPKTDAGGREIPELTDRELATLRILLETK